MSTPSTQNNLFAFASRKVAQGAKESLDVRIVFRLPALVDAAREGAAQNRQDANVFAVEILQEQT